MLVFEVWNGVGVGWELKLVLEGLLVCGGLTGLIPALLLPKIIKQHLFNYNLPPAKLIYLTPGALPSPRTLSAPLQKSLTLTSS